MIMDQLAGVDDASLSGTSTFNSDKSFRLTENSHSVRLVSVRRANPLTFTRLFTNGTRLRALALLECIGSLCDGRATWQVQNLHRQQLMGWEVATRGRFMSVTSVFSTAGYAVAARMFSRL